MTRRALVAPLLVLFLAVAAAESRSALAPPSAAELFAHVSALAAPEMEGRASGTAGGDRAARYIAERLAAMGLTPGGDGGRFQQSFVVSTATGIDAGTMLERLGAEPRPLELARDWTPHGGSLAGDVSAEVVFVGYGMVDAGRGWDDYAGVEVKDKIALALSGAPEHLPDVRVSRLDKLIAARRHGARALLIVGDALPSPAATGAPVRLVSGTVTPGGADLLLAPSGKTVAELTAALVRTRAPASLATGTAARLSVRLTSEDRRAANLVGILPGTDPARASEVLVLGAHYDHLGREGEAVYAGADDNASGTALVLGLARALAAAGGAPRTLVFALFAGEEKGLLGSAHYVRHPAVPVERTAAMLNFDMVGRMRDRRLSVGGVESGTGLRSAVTEASAPGALDLALHGAPFAPSDQIPFYEAGAPVLFFSTGGHEDYHTPRDTADKINAAGMAEVAGVAMRVVERLAGEARPTYVKLSRPARAKHAQHASGAEGGAFLGVATAALVESDGLRLASVLPGTAADRAGLRKGDVIVRLGDVLTNGFEDLRRALAQKRPGDALTVLYLRDGEDSLTTITLGARP